MKAKKILLTNNLVQLPHKANCIRLFTIVLIITIVIQQLYQQTTSSSSYIVHAKSFINPHNATAHTNSVQMQAPPPTHSNSQSTVLANQQSDNFNDPITSAQHMQSTTNSRPEAAAVLSPTTSILKAPVIVSKPEEVVVAPGSNVTLVCSAHGSQPMTFVWFQDEKNITHNTNTSSTRLLEEKRYEIFEEIGASNTTTSILYLMDLRISDTSMFLCWVENPAGYVFSNYTLTVSDSGQQAHTLSSHSSNVYQTPSGSLNYGSYPMLMIGLVFFLLGAIICIALQVYNCRQDHGANDHQIVSKKQSTSGGDNFSNKSSSYHDKKSLSSISPSGLANGGKYTPSSLGSVDEADGEEDEGVDDDLSQTSSCNKNDLRVLAVNDLQSFIEQMRSGIINMEYHSMSPVIQFNKNEYLDQTSTTLNNTNTSNRPQSAILSNNEQQQFQQVSQLQGVQYPQHQQLQYQQIRQPFTHQVSYTSAAPQTIANYQMQAQHQRPFQQSQPFHHHLQQQQSSVVPATQQQPTLGQPFDQLSYMNHIPSSSSSSSQTPFTNYGAGGDGYYY